MDMYETVCDLLKYADPELGTYKQLMKYKSQMERNVMLGPKATKFIQRLVQIKNDDIDCKRLTRTGLCKKRRTKCEYIGEEKFSSCSDFVPLTGRSDRPLSDLQIGE